MTINSDIVVIGGGPAGLACAITLSKKNYDVTVIEQTSKVTEKPGEILPPGIEPILEQLGVLNQFMSKKFLQHDGHFVDWNNISDFQSFHDTLDWKGFQIWRPDFDSILLEHAKKSGVRIISSCKALSPITKYSRIIGVNSDFGAIYSKILIDASGRQHWLSKQMNIFLINYSGKITVNFGYATGDTVCDSPIMRSIDSGWIWIAKIQPKLFQWIRLSFYDQIPYNWIPDDLKMLKKYGSTRRMDLTWRITSKPAGLGYFIVGDASSVLDPASSHGVLKALMSGMMTAYLISKIHNDSTVEEQAIEEYSKWIKDWFFHDVKKLKDLYKMHPNPPNWVLQNESKSIVN